MALVENIFCEKDVEQKMVQAIIQTKQIRIHASYNSMPRIDLGEILDENSLENRLVRPAYKIAKSITKTSSKVFKPKTYTKAIKNLIYRNRWRKAVDEELWNLDAHQT